jgi:hypothetical protein
MVALGFCRGSALRATFVLLFSSNARKVIVCPYVCYEREHVMKRVRVVMRKSLSRTTRGAATCLVLLTALASACKKTDDPPAAQAAFPTQTPATAVQPQAPGYGDGTAQQAVPVAAAAGVPAPVETLSQPGAFATPCQTDAPCLTHHCNVAAGKCAFPCQTDNDCMPGNRCIAPACLPKLQ